LLIMLVCGLFVANATLITLFSISLVVTCINVTRYVIRYRREASSETKKRCFGWISAVATIVQLVGLILMIVFWSNGTLIAR
jgi:hypothetical protein